MRPRGGSALGLAKTLPAKIVISPCQQKADNAATTKKKTAPTVTPPTAPNQVGLTKQHPDLPDITSHSCLLRCWLMVIVGTSALAWWLVGAWLQH